VPEEIVIRASILAATACWACAECLALLRLHDERARLFYTAASVLAIIHALAAFHFTYGWSQSAAIADTARQTAALSGLAWGGGLFVNYVFLALWLADVTCWWISPSLRARRPLILERTRLTLFIFMFVNGAVVFAGMAGRIVGVPAIGAIGLAWVRANRHEAVRA
jgi:hypothetical protein